MLRGESILMPSTPESPRSGICNAVFAAMITEGRARGIQVSEELACSACRCVDEPSTATLRRRITETFKGKPPLAVVAFDTPGIQKYVFAVTRPVLVYGGSRIVEKFTAPEEEGDGEPGSVYEVLQEFAIDPRPVVYAGGGGGLIVVAKSQAADLCEALASKLYEATAGELKTAVASLAVWPFDLGPDNREALSSDSLASLFDTPNSGASAYLATISAVNALLLRERSRAAVFKKTLHGHENKERCRACRVNPIAPENRNINDEKLQRCTACNKRYQEGRKGKRRSEQAESFQEIVDEDDMAVVYADGANVGDVFGRLESLLQYQVFSATLQEAFRHNMLAAIEQSLSTREDPVADRDRYQMPISGGDDLLVVLPAWAAFDLVLAFVTQVHHLFDLENNPKLGAVFHDAPEGLRKRINLFGVGVGIAVAKHTLPIRSLVDCSTQLLKSAKLKIHESQKDPESVERSAVDFMLLTSGSPLGSRVEEVRRRLYEVIAAESDGEPHLRLTSRPYTFSDFRKFRDDVDILRTHVETSQVYMLREEVGRGYSTSLNFWRYQIARSDEKKKGWRAYLREKGVDLSAADRLLWEECKDSFSEGQKVLSTSLIDAVDVMKFDREKRRQGGDS